MTEILETIKAVGIAGGAIAGLASNEIGRPYFVAPKAAHLIVSTETPLRTAILLPFFPVLLTCCASIEPQQFVGPNGKTAYSMRCSGMGRTLDACYKKAGEVCPSGYTIIDRASGIVAVDGMAAPQHNIAIECK